MLDGKVCIIFKYLGISVFVKRYGCVNIVSLIRSFVNIICPFLFFMLHHFCVFSLIVLNLLFVAFSLVLFQCSFFFILP